MHRNTTECNKDERNKKCHEYASNILFEWPHIMVNLFFCCHIFRESDFLREMQSQS